MNADRRNILFFFDVLIFKLNDAPYTATKKAIKLGRICLGNRDVLDTQIGELSFIAVFLDIEVYCNLITV